MQRHWEKGLWLLVLGLALWTAHPMLAGWQVWGHSSTIDYARLLELDDQIRHGVHYPRWCPDYYYGYGSPLFNFYAPGGYWIGEAFVLAGASILYGVKMPYAIAILLAALGMFIFARRLWGPVGGAAAAALYTLAPYFLLDVYVRASVGEALCFAWIPLALHFFHLGIRGAPRAGILGALFAAAVILTHNITALLFFPALLLFLVLHAAYDRDPRALRRGLGICGLALGLSAFFWLPAMAEKRFVRGEEVLTTGDYWYGDHFIGPRQLFEPRWGYGTSEPGDSISLQLGIPHWILTLAALVLALRVARLRGPSPAFLWIVFGGALFLTLPWSKFLWDHLPLIHFAQFPWRLLLFASFAASALAGSVLASLEKRGWPWQALAVSAVAAAALLAYGPYTHTRFVACDRTTREVRILEKEDLVGVRADPDLIRLEEFLTVNTMRRIGMRASILDDYLPIWVATKPVSYPEDRYEVVSGQMTVQTVEEQPLGRTYRVRSETGGYLEFFTFWFPGWVGRLDGAEVDLFPRRPSGCAGLDVPPGDHTVTLRFVNTPVRTAAEVVSVAALAFAVLILVRPRVLVRGTTGDRLRTARREPSKHRPR